MKKFLILFIVSFGYGEFYYQYGKKVELRPIKNISRNLDYKFYKDKKGRILGVNNKIIVKFTTPNINPILNKYNLTIIKKLYNNVYLLKLPLNSDTFDVINKLYNNPTIKFAQPDFLRKRTRR